MKNRIYSLLIPWFMDGAIAVMLTAVPLLALRFGADAAMLGMIGWIPQVMRFPVCLTSGRLSEHIGRRKLIIPAACIIVLACIGLANAHSNTQIIIFVSVVFAALGAFYPSLQAQIGDVSRRGELTKNLSAFNIGWCVGSAIMAICARWLVQKSLPLAFYAAMAGAFIAGALVVSWRNSSDARDEIDNNVDTPLPEYPKYILVIARSGVFTGFFALIILRMMFPQLGLKLGWSESNIATVVACVVAGQGVGMLATSAAPWWRGKLWPQVMAQSIMLISGVAICVSSSPVIIGAAFFFVGIALSTAYTAALYYGLSSRSARGKNTGTHESLVTAGSIVGALLGGFAAEHISLRAPYIMFACLAGLCLITTALLSFKRTTAS